MTNPKFPSRYDRNEMPVFLRNMRDNLQSEPETFVFDIDDKYRYIVTNSSNLKEMICESEECHIFRESNDYVDIPSAKGLIARVPGEFQCL